MAIVVETVSDSAKAREDMAKIRQAVIGIEKSSKDATSSMRNFAKAIAVTVVTFGSLKALSSVSDSITNFETKIRMVTKSSKEASQAFRGLANVSMGTRSNINAVATLYQKTAISTERLGTSQKDILKFTEAVTKSLAASGATATEQFSSIMQLGQGLAKGVLSGDEWRTIAEAAPIFSRSLAKGLKISYGELIKMAHAQELTTVKLLKGVLAYTDGIDEAFSKVGVTFSSAFTNLGNAGLLVFDGFQKAADVSFGSVAGKINDFALKMAEIGQRMSYYFAIAKDTIFRLMFDVEQLLRNNAVSIFFRDTVSGIIQMVSAGFSRVVGFFNNVKSKLLSAKLKIETSDIFSDLNLSLATVKEWAKNVEGWFFWLYDKVIGNSWVPDLVKDTVSWFGQLLKKPLQYIKQFVNFANENFKTLSITALWVAATAAVYTFRGSIFSVLSAVLSMKTLLITAFAGISAFSISKLFEKKDVKKATDTLKDGIDDSFDFKSVDIFTKRLEGKYASMKASLSEFFTFSLMEDFEFNLTSVTESLEGIASSIKTLVIKTWETMSRWGRIFSVTAVGAMLLIGLQGLVATLPALFATSLGLLFAGVLAIPTVKVFEIDVINIFNKVLHLIEKGLSFIVRRGRDATGGLMGGLATSNPTEILAIVAKAMLLFSAGRAIYAKGAKALISMPQRLSSDIADSLKARIGEKRLSHYQSLVAKQTPKALQAQTKVMKTAYKQQLKALSRMRSQNGSMLGLQKAQALAKGRGSSIGLTNAQLRQAANAQSARSGFQENLRSRGSMESAFRKNTATVARLSTAQTSFRDYINESRRNALAGVRTATGAVAGVVGGVAGFQLGSRIAEGMTESSSGMKMGVMAGSAMLGQFAGAGLSTAFLDLGGLFLKVLMAGLKRSPLFMIPALIIAAFVAAYKMFPDIKSALGDSLKDISTNLYKALKSGGRSVRDSIKEAFAPDPETEKEAIAVKESKTSLEAKQVEILEKLNRDRSSETMSSLMWELERNIQTFLPLIYPIDGKTTKEDSAKFKAAYETLQKDIQRRISLARPLSPKEIEALEAELQDVVIGLEDLDKVAAAIVSKASDVDKHSGIFVGSAEGAARIVGGSDISQQSYDTAKTDLAIKRAFLKFVSDVKVFIDGSPLTQPPEVSFEEYAKRIQDDTDWREAKLADLREMFKDTTGRREAQLADLREMFTGVWAMFSDPYRKGDSPQTAEESLMLAERELVSVNTALTTATDDNRDTLERTASSLTSSIAALKSVINAARVERREDAAAGANMYEKLGNFLTPAWFDTQYREQGKVIADAVLETGIARSKAIVEFVERDIWGDRSKKPIERASGGPVWGSGTATSDSIPALLSNGEYVINAESTKRHRGVLEAINSKKPTGIMGFSEGGLIAKGSDGPVKGDNTILGFISRGFEALTDRHEFAEAIGLRFQELKIRLERSWIPGTKAAGDGFNDIGQELGDPLRHAWASAAVTLNYGEDFALIVGDLHELDNMLGPENLNFLDLLSGLEITESNRQDFINNAVGRKVGKSSGDVVSAWDQIVGLLQDDLYSGNMNNFMVGHWGSTRGDLPEGDQRLYAINSLERLKQHPVLRHHLSKYADGGLASMGRDGDSMLAHINPAEADLLKAFGGSGTVNPRTGLREFSNLELGKDLKDETEKSVEVTETLLEKLIAMFKELFAELKKGFKGVFGDSDDDTTKVKTFSKSVEASKIPWAQTNINYNSVVDQLEDRTVKSFENFSMADLDRVNNLFDRIGEWKTTLTDETASVASKSRAKEQIKTLFGEVDKISEMYVALGDAEWMSNVENPAFVKIGEEFAEGVESDFKTGLSSLLHGKSDFKEFTTGILDNFTSNIIDTFVGGFTDSLFKSSSLDEGMESLGSGLASWSSSLFDGIDISSIFKSSWGWVKGLFSGYADGGYVSGPGTGTSDSIPARLSDGEFVVNAAATRANLGMLQAINSGSMRRFAVGGLATNLAPVNTNASVPQSTVVNLNITGDVSRQTKKEIYSMAPQIASMVEGNFRERRVMR